MPMPLQLRSIVSSLEDYAPWLTKIEGFDMEPLHQVIQTIPTEWIPSQEQLAGLIEFVAHRASNIKSLVRANPQLFVPQMGQGG